MSVGRMSAGVSTDASPAVAERIFHNTSLLAGSKRKVGDEVVDTGDSEKNGFDQSPRPLKKARSPSYKPTSENIRKPGDSVLGKRQREDFVTSAALDTSEIDNEESDRVRCLSEKTRTSSEGVREASNAILNTRQRGDVPWADISHVPASQTEHVRAILDGVEEKVEVTTEEARKAEKAAFVRLALGIKDPAPPVAAPAKIDSPRAYRPIWDFGRPARSLFFGKRGDADRPDQKPVKRRINFEEDDEVRDPSVYRNPPANLQPSVREMREDRARRRTAADIAEHEADLAAVRKAREEAEAEGLTPIESITKAAAAKNIKKSSKTDKGQQRKDTATLKKDSKASKGQQNKDTNTLTPKSPTSNNGRSKDTAINLDDDAGMQNSNGKSKDTAINLDSDAGVHNSPLAQTTGAERNQKPREGKDKKLQRAERAKKKKEWKDKIAAWSTAAQGQA